MWQVIRFFFLLTLIAACHNEDEVVPVPPATTETPAPAIDPESSQQSGDHSSDLESETFQYGSFRNMPYRFLAPRNYNSSKTYPLHIFLHGIGERGSDNEAQLQAGAAYFEADSIRKAYPAFVIFPQCPDSHFWFDEAMTDKLRALIDSVVTQPSIDAKHLSIGGFSMGAYGTFAMVARNPDLFKSAIAISGDGDERKAGRMKESNWRLFAGAHDAVVPSAKTEKMAKALARAGASVSFTLYPDADHGRTLRRAFSEPDLFDWLFSDGEDR